MDDFKHICPVCKNKGVTNFLQLRQINLNNAVYLCKDIRCIYPQGHSWIYVERKLSSSDDEDSDCDTDVNDDIEALGILAQKKQKPIQNVNDDSLVSNLNLGDIKEGTNQTNNEIFTTSWSHDVKNMLNIEIVHPAVTVENTEQVSKEVTNEINNEMFEKSWNENLKNTLNIEIVHPAVTFENTEQVSETTGNKIKNNENIVKNIENKSKNDENEIKNYILSSKPLEEPNIFNSHIPMDFHAVFNTRLRLKSKCKKDNDYFKLPDGILQQALQNIQTEKERKPKKKKNIVDDILGQKRNLPDLTDSAACFEGFKFSSKTIKPPNTDEANKIQSKSPKISSTLSKSSKNRTKNLREGKVLEFTPNPNCSKDKLETEENIMKDDTTLSLLNDLIDTMDDGTDNNASYKIDDPEFESWLESYVIT